MVNTFLLDLDFRVSASKLDRARLGKQRVEAHQILQTIQQYRFLAHYLGLPDFPVGLDTPKEERRGWASRVVRAFRLSGLTGLLIRGPLVIEYHHGDQLPRRPESGHELHHDPSSGIIYETKGVKRKVVAVGPWTDFVLPGDNLITTRIRVHPAIEMWLGFEDALRDYINAHIEKWISRGYENNMETYQVPPSYPRPAWTYSPEVIRNFRSTLIEREIDRLEPVWYLRQDDFIEAWCTTKENAACLKAFVRTLPNSQWWQCASRADLLTLGRFPGFIWP